MTLRINTNKLKSIAVFGLLFFAAMNFYAKFFYFAFASLLVLFVIQRKLAVNKKALLYLGLGVLMAIYNRGEGLLSMIRCMAGGALYIVGYNMVLNVSPKKIDAVSYDSGYARKTGFLLLATVATGSFTHYILNFANSFSQILVRNTNDVWTGQAMAATGQATLACLMLGLSVAMVFLSGKWIYRAVGIACLIGMLAYNLVLAGRTMFVILFVLFIIALIYVRVAAIGSFEKLKVSVGFVLALLAFALVFIYNVGGVQDYVLDSNLFDRFGSSLEAFTSESSRMNSKISFVLNALKYPLGGLNLRAQYGYAHDLLLDGYDEYGFLGFGLLFAILGFGIASLYKLLRHTRYDSVFKLALLCVYSAVLLVFCAEPILAGMQWLFVCYCLINGCIDGMNLSYFSGKSGEVNESIAN